MHRPTAGAANSSASQRQFMLRPRLHSQVAHRPAQAIAATRKLFSLTATARKAAHLRGAGTTISEAVSAAASVTSRKKKRAMTDVRPHASPGWPGRAPLFAPPRPGQGGGSTRGGRALEVQRQRDGQLERVS